MLHTHSLHYIEERNWKLASWKKGFRKVMQKKKKEKNYWNIVLWASSTFIGALGLALVLKGRRVREIKSCHMHTLPCRYTNTNSSTVRLLACNFQIQIDFQFLFKNKEQGRPKKKKNISAFSVPLFMAAYIEHWQLLQKKCLLGWQQQQLFCYLALCDSLCSWPPSVWKSL